MCRAGKEASQPAAPMCLIEGAVLQVVVAQGNVSRIPCALSTEVSILLHPIPSCTVPLVPCSVEDWLGKELGHTEVVMRSPGQLDSNGQTVTHNQEEKVTRPGWHEDDDRPKLQDRLGLTMLHAFAHYYPATTAGLGGH